jgi:hypothetical protein
VTYLGASVPTQHFAQLLHELGPDVTALSCALPTRLFEAREMIEVSRAAGVPVIVGGRGFGPKGVWGRTLGANAWAPDAREAVDAIGEDALESFTTPAQPLPAVDGAVFALDDRAERIVADGLAIMRERMHDVAGYDSRQLKRTAEDIAHIVEFLRAALFVDDPLLFTDFATWLRDILVARGVPADTLRHGLRLVADVISSEPGPYERALEFLADGVTAIS